MVNFLLFWPDANLEQANKLIYAENPTIGLLTVNKYGYVYFFFNNFFAVITKCHGAPENCKFVHHTEL